MPPSAAPEDIRAAAETVAQAIEQTQARAKSLVSLTLTFRITDGADLLRLGKLLMTPEERERLVTAFANGAAQGAYTYFREIHEPGAHRLCEHRLAVHFADVLCLH